MAQPRALQPNSTIATINRLDTQEQDKKALVLKPKKTSSNRYTFSFYDIQSSRSRRDFRLVWESENFAIPLEPKPVTSLKVLKESWVQLQIIFINKSIARLSYDYLWSATVDDENPDQDPTVGNRTKGDVPSLLSP